MDFKNSKLIWIRRNYFNVPKFKINLKSSKIFLSPRFKIGLKNRIQFFFWAKKVHGKKIEICRSAMRCSRLKIEPWASFKLILIILSWLSLHSSSLSFSFSVQTNVQFGQTELLVAELFGWAEHENWMFVWRLSSCCQLGRDLWLTQW